jgi:hypothetical protein
VVAGRLAGITTTIGMLANVTGARRDGGSQGYGRLVPCAVVEGAQLGGGGC